MERGLPQSLDPGFISITIIANMRLKGARLRLCYDRLGLWRWVSGDKVELTKQGQQGVSQVPEYQNITQQIQKSRVVCTKLWPQRGTPAVLYTYTFKPILYKKTRLCTVCSARMLCAKTIFNFLPDSPARWSSLFCVAAYDKRLKQHKIS